MFDFIIVGAGIAGLTTAELLQRSGQTVLLLEAASKICAQATARQQGWFHTGALYAALPGGAGYRQSLQNLDVLNSYYRCYSRMNLPRGGSQDLWPEHGWFSDRTVNYFFASALDRSIALWQKPLWQMATLCAQSRLHGYEIGSKPCNNPGNSNQYACQLDGTTQDRVLGNHPSRPRLGTTLQSIDRTFSATTIIQDLLSSFLCHGGTLRTEQRVSKTGPDFVDIGRKRMRARHTIVTAGTGIARLSKVPVRTVKCPILFISPALSTSNFVWLSMNIDTAFNHVFHKTKWGEYSLIGDNSYFDINAHTDDNLMKRRILDKLGNVYDHNILPDETTLYWGTKTEFVRDDACSRLYNKIFRRAVAMPETYGAKPRNYRLYLKETENGLVALPGKMSHSFSLAVAICRHFGIEPEKDLSNLEECGALRLIGETIHEEIVTDKNRHRVAA